MNRFDEGAPGETGVLLYVVTGWLLPDRSRKGRLGCCYLWAVVGLLVIRLVVRAQYDYDGLRPS